MFPSRTGRLALALASVGLVFAPGLMPMANADDPLFVNTTSALPALTSEYDPVSDDDCIAGRTKCIDKMIKDFRNRFRPLAKACVHNAPFAMMYLRVSQTYRWSLDQTKVYKYKNPSWMNHVVAVFGGYYKTNYDNWAAGNRSLVPDAWLTALDAAAGREVTLDGNLLLGANAHINRDLAYAMAAAGLVDPTGTSGKHDYDLVNDLINTVIAPLNAEIDARFEEGGSSDPTVTNATYTFTSQLMASWREQAWRNAEALIAAKDDPLAYLLVTLQIETYAAEVAKQVKEDYSYKQGASSKPRDDHCAVHYGDTGPLPYAFGYASAF